jgi:hypothetical protein
MKRDVDCLLPWIKLDKESGATSINSFKWFLEVRLPPYSKRLELSVLLALLELIAVEEDVGREEMECVERTRATGELYRKEWCGCLDCAVKSFLWVD